MYAYIHRFSRFCLGEAESDRSSVKLALSLTIWLTSKKRLIRLCSTFTYRNANTTLPDLSIAIAKLENC